MAGEVVIGVDPGLLFCLTGLGTLADPFEFPLQGLLARFVFAGLLRQPFGLLLQPGGVIALVGNAPPAVEFQNPAGDVIKEIAVMSDDQDRAFVIDQVLLQPSDGLRVQVVGWFVEEQHIGRFEKQLAERHAAAFAAREMLGHRLIGRAAQRLHRDIDLAVEIPEIVAVDLILQLRHLVGGLVGIVHREFVEPVEFGLFLRDAEHDIVADRKGFVELRLLWQVPDFRALGGPGFAREVFVQAGHDLHQRGFTRAIDPDNADFHAGQKAQPDVFKAFLAAWIGLGDAVHVIDILIAGHAGMLRRKSGFSVT